MADRVVEPVAAILPQSDSQTQTLDSGFTLADANDAATEYAVSGHDPVNHAPPDQLRQKLRGYQIFFIILSGALGGAIFNTSGLRLAGPVGLLTATIFTGFIALCVGETLSEMVQVFPVPNSIFVYIDAWIDEDLAWTMGILYWYTWAMVFPIEMLGAAKLVSFWNPAPVWPPLVFYFLVPCILVAINLFQVNVYGVIETVGGTLKALLALVVAFVLYHISAIHSLGGNNGPINALFQANPDYVKTPARAFCYVVPFIVLGFVGVEGGVVAAYEARSRRDVGWPSLWTHWILFFLYFLMTLGIALTVSWDHPSLPPIFGGSQSVKQRGTDTGYPTVSDPPNTTSATILAIHAFIPSLAGVANGCLLFCVLSAANTALYYSSRTLWGLTYNLNDDRGFSKWFRKLSVLMDNGAPGRAVVISVVLFCWVPFMQLGRSLSIDHVFEVLCISSGMSCLLVWLALLVAFLRFKAWTTLCAEKGTLAPEYGKYVRNSLEYRKMAKNKLLTIQPWIAWAGIIGILLVFIFITAMWWDTPPSADKILAGLGSHMAALIFLVCVKACRGRLTKWWVPLKADGENISESLNGKLHRMEFLAEKSEDREGKESGRREMEQAQQQSQQQSQPQPLQPCYHMQQGVFR